MAKIEIKGTLDKLEDIAVFLETNHIRFTVVEEKDDEYLRNLPRYRNLIMKYEK